MTHHQLIHALWGTTHYRDAMHLLRVTMSNLRRKLTREPNSVWIIATEPRVGYRLGNGAPRPALSDDIFHNGPAHIGQTKLSALE